MSSKTRERDRGERMMDNRTDTIVVAAAASVVLSLVQYYGRGRKETGIFVGLWAPTLLAFANYYKHDQTAERLEDASSGGRVIDSVERMVGGRSR